MSGKKFAVGSSVFFALAIASQGVPVNAEGVVVEVPHMGQIAPSEFANMPHAGRVLVSIYGKVLEVPEGALRSEPVNAIADSGAGDLAGINGQSTDRQSASNGENGGTGPLDAGAAIAEGDYSIKDAIDELVALAADGANAAEILAVAEKLEAIAA